MDEESVLVVLVQGEGSKDGCVYRLDMKPRSWVFLEARVDGSTWQEEIVSGK